MLGLLIQPVILCGLLYLFARHEADYDFWRVTMVATGVSVVSWICGMFLALHGLAPLALLVWFALCAWAFVRFCYVPWPKALLVALIHLILCGVFLLAFSRLTAWPGTK
jgi:hypothetical protein